jgi:hypothetical protein
MPCDFAAIRPLNHSPLSDYRGDVFGRRNVEGGVIKLNAIWRVKGLLPLYLNILSAKAVYKYIRIYLYTCDGEGILRGLFIS